MRTTVGQLLVNQMLPPELRDYSRTLDKKKTGALLKALAERGGDEYSDAMRRLLDLAGQASFFSGGDSFGVEHLRTAKAARRRRMLIERDMQRILSVPGLTAKQREDQIVLAVGKHLDPQQTEVLEESLAEGNPLARQVASGARGNKMNLSTLRASDMLYEDQRGRVIPVPVLRSYSEGLSPAEYWAGTYGARKGVVDVKLSVAKAGYLGKRLNQATHRLVVTGIDADKDDGELRGLPVDVDDDDNEGSLLAAPAGPYKRNTHLTPKVLADLKRHGVKRILVRSPLSGGAPDGGLYARDVGVREFGRLPMVGESPALMAVQALSEPISQNTLSSKHSGGVAGAARTVSGFDLIDSLVQVPKTIMGGAAHSDTDGTVQTIEAAPAGGTFVTINGMRHFVAPGFAVNVKRGQAVEAGDVISEGVPNPGKVVEHKGVGEGRRYFTKVFRDAMRDAGMTSHRRNVELLARGLIDHVQLTDEYADGVPDDVVPYQTLEASYKPRPDSEESEPKRALGRYLERPILHYTVGTKIRPSVVKELAEFGVTSVRAHKDPPPFLPVMIRSSDNTAHDPDWMTRMFGSGLKSSLLDSLHRGRESRDDDTSFVPGLAKSVDFGTYGKLHIDDGPFRF